MVTRSVFGDDDTAALLARLSRAWEAEYPRVASGGTRALSGFSFQFSLALLEVLERWKGMAGDRRAVPTVFVELLSDVAQNTLAGGLVITQVKRTQSAKAVREGLDDLQSVYEVAASEMPEQLSRIELELAFRTGKPENAWPLIEKWAEEDPGSRARVAEAVSVNLYPDPEHRIYALLVNELNAAEPVALFHRWLGRLMTAASQSKPEERRARLESGAEEIWASLIELEKGEKRRGKAYLWSPVDRLPDQVHPGEVLASRQPSAIHLRKGYLAPRPDALRRVQAGFDRWLAERDKEPVQTTVPMFWIGGRSGSGKSALLLQLLAALQEQGTGPVLWLSDRSEQLTETARWARDAFESERVPVIGLDDPYAPDGSRDQVWGGFLAEMTGGLEAGERDDVPILVCAGPVEQAEAFARDFPSDFDVKVVELEREQPEELKQLRDWYEQRTGRAAPGPSGENVLLVQLFFEWRAGVGLDAFAQRFQRRLQEADRETEGDSLTQVLAEVLALNRVYVGYPAREMRGRLSDRQADFLNQLREEEHIAIDEEPGRSGVWFAHPHLANEIYESWFPLRSTASQRRGHFVKAGLACLRDGEHTREKTAPIRALVQALGASGHFLDDRIDPDFVGALPELYAAAREDSPLLPVEQLILWVEAQLVTGASLDPDPVEDALPRIEPDLSDDPAAGRLCETLLTAFGRLTASQRGRLRGAVVDLLAQAPQWSEWTRVAAAGARTGAMPELADRIDAWLGGHLPLYRSGGVLLAALAKYETDVRFEALAMRLLRGQPRHPAWGRVWNVIWGRQKNEELAGLAESWLRANGSNRSWSFVWAALTEDGVGGLRALGTEWLAENPEHAGWSVVWRTLWQDRYSDDLEKAALRWLEGADINREGFGAVWSALWESGLHEDPAFRQRGEAALRRMSTESVAWARIFGRLLQVEPSEELWQVGLRWVDEATASSVGWGNLLPPLLAEALRREDDEAIAMLQRRGREFLRDANPNHVGWSYVFNALWDNSSDGLLPLGRPWIEDPDARAGWTFVWHRLWEDEASDWLGDRALLWLRDSIGQTGWARVWNWLCEKGPKAYASFDLESLLDLGESWLDRAGTDSRWPYVFLNLWEIRTHAEVRRLGLDWLTDNKDRYEPNWDRVWAVMWEDREPGRVEEEAKQRRLGGEWLEVSAGHDHWSTVWCALWDDDPDAYLRRLGERWLRDKGASNYRRRLVSTRLVAAQPTAPPKRAPREPGPKAREVRALGRRIRKTRRKKDLASGLDLMRRGPSSGKKVDQLAWQNLWVALWKAQPSDELRKIAMAWIETPASTASRGRSYVWEMLWKQHKTLDLYAIGCEYLESAPFNRAKWATIWQELWEYRRSSPLKRLAVTWLDAGLEEALGEAQGRWPQVWCRVFEAERTPELAAIGRRWLRGCPEHRAAPRVRDLLLARASRDDLEGPPYAIEAAGPISERPLAESH